MNQITELMTDGVCAVPVQETDLPLSVVVPCYNEEEVLQALYDRLCPACEKVVGSNFEIVLVNDGSRDRTWEIMSDLSAKDYRVVSVNLSRNHGHQLALTAGLSVCRGDRILIIDADLQDPPELLGDMMARMDEGFEVVYGQRAKRAGESWFKKASAAAFYRFLRSLTDVDIPVDTGDFRLMSRRALRALQSMPEQHRFIRGMVTWIGFKQCPLPYDRAERFAGETKYPLRKMIRFALDAITSFSIFPLRVASHFGVALAVAGVMMLGYTLYGWFAHDVIEGWTSVMTAVLILGSGQMLFLGVLGEYLGRLYMESKRRPLFIIDDIVCSEGKNAASKSTTIAKRAALKV